MAVKLTLRTPSSIPLEIDDLGPEQLAGLPELEVARRLVRHGNRYEALGEHFQVEIVARLPDDIDLLITGDTRNVHGIGRSMTGGGVVAESAVGRHAGAGMTGGRLMLQSGAADWLGAEMQGGTIEVHGTVGDCAGAAYRGSRRGMTGGEIHIRGDAGHELGALMRRGLIVVEGGTGEFAAAGMIAGTVLVNGVLGRRAGAGMKRGTLVALGGVAEIAPGFRYSCRYEPVFLQLLSRSLVSTPARVVNCYRGDVLNGGRGELWLADSPRQ